MIGRINSLQSLGAVDGPGLRYVIFMQGCPLRCSYCHNPETWDYDGGTEYEAKELFDKIVRYKSYFGKKGGVTVTGGEPLLQPKFIKELFMLLKEENINTCIDTSGVCNINELDDLLDYTDLVLLDVKFLTDEEYIKYTGSSIKPVLKFLDLLHEKGIKAWIRHVVAPTINDDEGKIIELKNLCAKYDNIEKIELLPFRKLCLEKYENLNMKFPFENIDELSVERLKQLNDIMN